MPLIGNDEDLIVITSGNGVRFRARLLRKGGEYGRTNSLVADQPMVEFYDTRYDHSEYGQFVSRYYVDTLLDTRCHYDPGYRYGDDGCSHGGLTLDTGSRDWWIDAAAMKVVRAWLRLEAER